MTIRLLTVCLLELLLCSCHNRETGFHYLPAQTRETVYPKENDSLKNQKYEYVVVSDLPGSADAARTLLLRYCMQKADQDAIAQRFSIYKMSFYRESKATPRNYRSRDGYLNADHIGDHTDDLMAEYNWRRCGPGSGTWTFAIKDHQSVWQDSVLSTNCP